MLLCRQLDLFGPRAPGGGWLTGKAANNKDHNFMRASLREFVNLTDARLDPYLQRLHLSDIAEQAAGDQ